MKFSRLFRKLKNYTPEKKTERCKRYYPSSENKSVWFCSIWLFVSSLFDNLVSVNIPHHKINQFQFSLIVSNLFIPILSWSIETQISGTKYVLFTLYSLKPFWSAYQMTVFYMKCNTGLKWVKRCHKGLLQFFRWHWKQMGWWIKIKPIKTTAMLTP